MHLPVSAIELRFLCEPSSRSPLCQWPWWTGPGLWPETARCALPFAAWCPSTLWPPRPPQTGCCLCNDAPPGARGTPGYRWVESVFSCLLFPEHVSFIGPALLQLKGLRLNSVTAIVIKRAEKCIHSLLTVPTVGSSPGWWQRLWWVWSCSPMPKAALQPSPLVLPSPVAEGRPPDR